MIYVYLDEGALPRSARQIVHSLRHMLQGGDDCSIRYVDHRFLTEEPAWEKDATLLVFPGGRANPYHKKLQGLGNQRIVNFVQKGGTYLGVCAGGYYGARFVEFEKGEALEVCTELELGFFPGKAIGSAYGKGLFCYESEKGARSAKVEFFGKQGELYFNGGCFFEAPQNHSHIRSLASYTDLEGQPAAIVECSVGQGKAILCGVHPEYHPSGDPHQKDFGDFRRFVWEKFLSLLDRNL